MWWVAQGRVGQGWAGRCNEVRVMRLEWGGYDAGTVGWEGGGRGTAWA